MGLGLLHWGRFNFVLFAAISNTALLGAAAADILTASDHVPVELVFLDDNLLFLLEDATLPFEYHIDAILVLNFALHQ